MEQNPTTACLLALRMTGGLLIEPEAPPGPQPGHRMLAPDIEAVTSNNQTFSLRAHRGKIVVLHFWESWCKPCLESLSSLEYAARGRDDVLFIGSSSETAQRIEETRFSKQVTFPCLVDRHRRIIRRYGITAIPTTVVIDAEGGIADVLVGHSHSARLFDAIGKALEKEPRMHAATVSLR